MFASFFGQPWDQMGQKCQYLAKKVNFGPNLAVYGPKILTFMWVSKSFGIHKTENHLGNLFELFFNQAFDQMGQKCPYLAKYASFGPNLAVYGPKILISMGVSKSFGTNITENHFGNLSALFFGQALDQMGQKCRYLAQNASFGPNFAVFWQKIQFFGRMELNFWYPHIRKPMAPIGC